MFSKNLFKDEKATALIIFALGVFVLFGFAAFVIDVGDMYVGRRSMANAADAGALAGARELALSGDDNLAIEAAREYAEEKNGAETSDISIVTIDGGKSVRVTASINKEHFFAKIMGFSDTNVSATASASWGCPTGSKNLLPMFFLDEGLGLPSGQQVLLAPKLGPGNWGLVDVSRGKKGINEIFSGESSNELVRVGETLMSATGNPQSRVSAIEERMQRAKDPSSGVKMDGIIPIVQGDLEGSSELTVLGFAYFKIIDVIVEETKEKDDHKWYGKGSVHAHLQEVPKLYAEGYDKKQELSDEFPMGAVIGEFIIDSFVPSSDWTSFSQNSEDDYGIYVVQLVE